METVGMMTNALLSDVNRAIKDDLAHTVLHNMAVASIYVLVALYKTDGQRATDLAAAQGVAPTSFTPTLDRLERAGLARRAQHPSDRRSIIVSLTAEGKKLQAAVENAIGNAEVKYGDVFAPRSKWRKEHEAE